MFIFSEGKQIKNKLTQILKRVKEHEPVAVMLDDLDEISGNVTDAQKEASGEALIHTKNAQRKKN